MSAKKPFLLPATKIETSSVNTSTENRGRGDGVKKVVLKSVTVKMEVPASYLEQLAISENDSIDFQGDFFRKDGTPKDAGIGVLPFISEYNDQVIVLTDDKDGKINRIRLITKKIHKFGATCKPGNMVDLSLQFQVYPDSIETLSWQLDQLLVYPHYLLIEGPVQREIDDKQSGEPEKEKPSKKKANKKPTKKAA